MGYKAPSEAVYGNLVHAHSLMAHRSAKKKQRAEAEAGAFENGREPEEKGDERKSSIAMAEREI